MSLDVNSEKGLVSVSQESMMLKYISEMWNCEIITTDKTKEGKCDGFIVKDGILKGLFESKCRNMSIDQLEKFDTWLVTNEKLESCRLMSELLRVPLFGFLYLVDNNLSMYWKITDEYGNYLFKFDVEKTKTQKNINGGEIIRPNAYLPVKYAKYFKKLKQ